MSSFGRELPAISYRIRLFSPGMSDIWAQLTALPILSLPTALFNRRVHLMHARRRARHASLARPMIRGAGTVWGIGHGQCVRGIRWVAVGPAFAPMWISRRGLPPQNVRSCCWGDGTALPNHRSARIRHGRWPMPLPNEPHGRYPVRAVHRASSEVVGLITQQAGEAVPSALQRARTCEG